MSERSQISHIACLSLFCAFITVGCAADGKPSLSQVEEFDAYHVYYAGEEVARLPLEEVLGEDWKVNEQSVRWTFIYGDCDPPSGLFAEGGCQPPLQIQNYGDCRRRPGMFPGKSGTFDFRGTKASWRRGRGFEVFTGRTTVVIFGTRGSIVKAAARQLRNVRQERRPPLLPRAVSAISSCR
jgi:hypothetical protein